MDFPKNFEPRAIEEKWTSRWKEKKHFKSLPDDRPPFTVVIPPPNVTGVLHMGHTLNETVQDILVRWARMNGFNACWVPGSDHASIATEARVVAMLREKGIQKSDLTREEFLAHAYAWKEKYGNIIYQQIERLGCSVDWDRVSFTMDPHYYQAVIGVFVDLYRKGLIYRGARMIHWDSQAQTALSDEEVEYRDIRGVLYHVAYAVVDHPGQAISDSNPRLIIATQRPETIPGDTAICVHPDDERYRSFHGKYAVVPFSGRVVPIITDDYIDPAFGTGVLKVTPAHDINDYNLGLKHHLEVIDTLDAKGRLTEAAGPFAGLDRFEARKRMVADLKERGLLVKVEEYDTRAGYSQRTHCIVEPRISTQWFVSMNSLAEKALQPVLDGKIRIYPEERFLNTYRNWLTGTRDWCISRQLWWGQRIPAWYDEEGKMVVAVNEEAAKEQYQQEYGVPAPALRQDEDVLDTWFSSWLWPLEVFRGITQPDNPEINYYYPTSVLVTGQDIIFFWVARMIMAGMEFRGEIPFRDVYFTGMVRDRQGRKMSKSLGNSPDLIELIDRYGADAVRFGIMVSAPAGNDLLFDENSPQQGRNFNNKIWNALKLVCLWGADLRNADNTAEAGSGREGFQVVDVSGFSGTVELGDLTGSLAPDADEDFAVRWFQARLSAAREELEKAFAQYRLSEALKLIYSLIWDDFCSWYLEWVKPSPGESIDRRIYLHTVRFFCELMHLLHPFMPFITEEVYERLRPGKGELCVRQYPPVTAPSPKALNDGELIRQAITAIREARSRHGLKNKDRIKLYIITEQPEVYQDAYHILCKQAHANAIAFQSEALGESISVVVGKERYFLETTARVDHSAQIESLQKELQYMQGFLEDVERKLSNPRFVEKAPEAVVTLERRKKSDAEEKIRIIRESLSRLQD